MTRMDNKLVILLNFLIFLLSVPILAGGVWLSTRDASHCDKFMQVAFITLGMFLLMISFVGIVIIFFRKSFLWWIYRALFLVIVIVLCFTILTLLVTNKGAGHVVSKCSFKEYNLEDFSTWLQKRMEDSKNWEKIRSCLMDTKICQSLRESNQTFNQFRKNKLSPPQSGCCKPPMECGFDYQNATAWSRPSRFTRSTNMDMDCGTWQNHQAILCYDCRSCKAGVLADVKQDWNKVATINIVFLIFLMIANSVGCWASGGGN